VGKQTSLTINTDELRQVIREEIREYLRQWNKEENEKIRRAYLMSKKERGNCQL
jgi:hypothetical protein